MNHLLTVWIEQNVLGVMGKIKYTKAIISEVEGKN